MLLDTASAQSWLDYWSECREGSGGKEASAGHNSRKNRRHETSVQLESQWGERLQELWRISGGDQFGHQFGRNRSQQETGAEMASGDVESLNFSGSQNRQASLAKGT
jgi:hypothetical protein